MKKFKWQQLADLPGAADAFCYDPDASEPDETLASFIHDYSTAFTHNDQLTTYLSRWRFSVDEHGVEFDNYGLIIAATIFAAVQDEYDSGDHKWPTWEAFGLSGDDDVDYCGSQPSCLTDLLVAQP